MPLTVVSALLTLLFLRWTHCSTELKAGLYILQRNNQPEDNTTAGFNLLRCLLYSTTPCCSCMLFRLFSPLPPFPCPVSPTGAGC